MLMLIFLGRLFSSWAIAKNFRKGTLRNIPTIPLVKKKPQNIKKEATLLHLITSLDIQTVCKSTNDLKHP